MPQRHSRGWTIKNHTQKRQKRCIGISRLNLEHCGVSIRCHRCVLAVACFCSSVTFSPFSFSFQTESNTISQGLQFALLATEIRIREQNQRKDVSMIVPTAKLLKS